MRETLLSVLKTAAYVGAVKVNIISTLLILHYIL